MKRCYCLALIIIAGIWAGSGSDASASAYRFALGGNSVPTSIILADDQENDKRRDSKDKPARRGLGARFWGGPYWGYGPRWGHPCRKCQSTCENENDSAECRRCRLRCGW